MYASFLKGESHSVGGTAKVTRIGAAAVGSFGGRKVPLCEMGDDGRHQGAARQPARERVVGPVDRHGAQMARPFEAGDVAAGGHPQQPRARVRPGEEERDLAPPAHDSGQVS